MSTMSIPGAKPLHLGDKKYDELVKALRVSYPNACVLWIDQVESRLLELRFQERQYQMPDAKVVQLYHGTSSNNVPIICEQGWQASLNKRAAYGPGSYFATAASYSKEYTNVGGTGVSYMLVADILVNKIGLANQVIAEDETISTYVDSVSKPTIYVARHDHDALPRYVIAFHKSAATQQIRLERQAKKKGAEQKQDKDELDNEDELL